MTALSPSETTARKIAFVLNNATEALADDPKHPGFAVLKVQKPEDVIPPLLNQDILSETDLLGVSVRKTPVMRTERVDNGHWYRNEADTLVEGYDEKEYIDHYDVSVSFSSGKRRGDAFLSGDRLYLNTEAVNDAALDRKVDSAINDGYTRADVTKLAGPQKGTLQKVFSDAAKISEDFTVERAVEPGFARKLKAFVAEVNVAGQKTGVIGIIGKGSYLKLVAAETRLKI
jgi:hypothetical protein